MGYNWRQFQDDDVVFPDHLLLLFTHSWSKLVDFLIATKTIGSIT